MKLEKSVIMVFIGIGVSVLNIYGQNYKIVDTGQTKFYNNTIEISIPASESTFYGQDAQFSSHQPSYTDNGDGTITDKVTGLMWQKSPDLDGDRVIMLATSSAIKKQRPGSVVFILGDSQCRRNADHKPSGIHFYNLVAAGLFQETKRMIFLK